MLAQSRAYSLIAFSFLLSAGGAFAQISAIEGVVKGADGQPIQKAEILIERKDMKGTYKGAKTDKKGHYIYNGLPLGKYRVSVIIDGQEKDFIEGVQTRLGDPVDISFDLKKSAEQQAQIAKSAESGSLTSDATRGMTKEQKDTYEKRAKENAATIQKNKALNDAFNAGKEAMAAKNYDAATQAFAKATEIDPAQHVIWASLADAYTQLASTKTGAEQED